MTRPPVDDAAAQVLAERYGAGGTHRRVTPLRVAAVLVALAGLALVTWVGVGIMQVPVRTQDAGFEIVDDAAIDVTFLVVRDPTATLTCRVHALSPSFAEVGAKDVTIGPSPDRALRVTTRVATSERATTGMVQACEVVPAP